MYRKIEELNKTHTNKRMLSLIEFLKKIPNNNYITYGDIFSELKIPRPTIVTWKANNSEFKKYISYVKNSNMIVFSNEKTRALLIKNGITTDTSRQNG